MSVKAPFNFVPVSNKVYFPDWANQISQDVPFSDGISGSFNLRITAETPILVGDDGKMKSFCQRQDGKYFIPGSSIKGCVRNVLEIMSFSRMTMDSDSKFAQREWDNSELYPLKRQQADFHCGYLKEQNNKYVIEDHGKPYRIGHDEIDKYLGKGVFRSRFSRDSHFNLNQLAEDGLDPKTAAYKYHLAGEAKLSGLSFSETNTTTEYSTRLKVDRSGILHGNIVFTGQPDQWMWPRPTELKRGAGKFYEFVFPSGCESQYPVSREDYLHFKFIYSESSEWERAKELLSGDGIPIFFRLVNGKVKDFGMAYLYKLPYENTPIETLSEEHRKPLLDKLEQKPVLDLAQCIFGCTSPDYSLKGRVHFSHAVSDNAIEDQEYAFTPGSPKASYYPIYIRQDGKGHYKTYNDGIISGWKRYHVRNRIWTNQYMGDKVSVNIRPLKAGTSFIGKVSFHNLRKIELGALLSAITFHQTVGCFHNLGQGKSFGFGKVRMDIFDCFLNQRDLMGAFEEAMIEAGFKDWSDSFQIKQLFTIAHESVPDTDEYKYMQIDIDARRNDFVDAKRIREYLKTYSEIIAKSFGPRSIYQDMLHERKKEDEERAQQEYELQLQQRLENEEKTTRLKNEGSLLLTEGKYIEAKLKFEEAASLGIDLCSEQISQCQKYLSLGEKTLEQSLSLSSIGSCGGSLKNWKKVHDISESDCSIIAMKISQTLTTMKKAQQKDWQDWKKWKPIIDALQSEEMAMCIYKQIVEQ